MIFIDTGIWYAAHVSEDPEHETARQLLAAATSSLVTTDYVVDELLTLLVMRKHRDVALRIGDDFWSEKTSDLIWTTQEDVEAAWAIFKRYSDKTWSFTDCVSYAVMQRMSIREAFALDAHFRQFGFASVRP